MSNLNRKTPLKGVKKPSLKKGSQKRKCKECGVIARTKKGLCEQCSDLKQKQLYREKNNIYVFDSINGELELQLPNIDLSGSVVFSIASYKELTKEDTCDKLILSLLGLLKSEPIYIKPVDIKWLTAMLVHLLNCDEVSYHHYIKNQPVTSVKDLPIRLIGGYLERWVRVFQGESYHPMLPTYALATCEFINSHISGSYQHLPGDDIVSLWEIKPWVNFSERENGCVMRFVYDKTFKKNFTEQSAHLLLACELPAGVEITFPSLRDDIIVKGAFDFHMKRCYLSESFYDYSDGQIQGLNEPKFDVLSRFKLPGEIVFPERRTSYSYRQFSVEILPEWIVGVKRHVEAEIIPLPKWLTS